MKKIFYDAANPNIVYDAVLNAHEMTLFGEHIPIRFRTMLLELDKIEFDEEKNELYIKYNSEFKAK